ncbi:GNAT family N-acetyltransferase [Pseudahrensia aquimaris]|uniref:GNAT family N-acetyltransferase n=1 Tax=Pseudahrensia aquimaris TaxID=744461 RepID=A0ABW3FCB7_9HYPH
MTHDTRLFQSSDASAVTSLLRDAFQNPAEAELVLALRNDGDMALEMVCEIDGRIIGHIAYSTVQAPVWALALAPLSVAPPYQGQGAGSDLVNRSLKHLAVKGWEAIFVLGDREYYERFGFTTVAAKNFNSPYEGDNFLALELKPGCLTGQHGDVRHADAFGKL